VHGPRHAFSDTSLLRTPNPAPKHRLGRPLGDKPGLLVFLPPLRVCIHCREHACVQLLPTVTTTIKAARRRHRRGGGAAPATIATQKRSQRTKIPFLVAWSTTNAVPPRTPAYPLEYNTLDWYPAASTPYVVKATWQSVGAARGTTCTSPACRVKQIGRGPLRDRCRAEQGALRAHGLRQPTPTTPTSNQPLSPRLRTALPHRLSDF